jgi:hypothetical protein
VVAAQVAVALAPLRAELAVGQRHAPAVAAVATTAVQRRREWTQVPLPDALDRQGKRESFQACDAQCQILGYFYYEDEPSRRDACLEVLTPIWLPSRVA